MSLPRDLFPSRPGSGPTGHAVRAHSKFSASGAERWFKCPGSVELSEGLPDKTSVWAEEGTKAHEVLEVVLRGQIAKKRVVVSPIGTPTEMSLHAFRAASFILGLHDRTPDSEVLVETRIYLDFIHPEMFGTFDGAVIDHFGTLHVFDYKYGAGHMVSPTNNLQMIFYGIGLAHKYQWNFERVRLWIIQPRIKGYDGPLFWDLSIRELREYIHDFKQAVDRVKKQPETFVEGSWCHWCKAKSVCPIKQEAKLDKIKSVFTMQPFKKGKSDDADSENIHQGNSRSEDKDTTRSNAGRRQSPKGSVGVSEADWRKKANSKRR